MMASYKTNHETGKPFVREELQRIMKLRHLVSVTELKEIRDNAAEGYDLNRHEKAVLTRAINEKEGKYYSMNAAQQKAAKINWLLHSAMGAQGSLSTALYELSRCVRQNFPMSQKEHEIVLSQISADARAALKALSLLINRIQLYNTEKRECSKSKKNQQS